MPARHGQLPALERNPVCLGRKASHPRDVGVGPFQSERHIVVCVLAVERDDDILICIGPEIVEVCLQHQIVRRVGKNKKAAAPVHSRAIMSGGTSASGSIGHEFGGTTRPGRSQRLGGFERFEVLAEDAIRGRGWSVDQALQLARLVLIDNPRRVFGGAVASSPAAI